MIITSLDQLDENKTYTYADYFLWRLKERVELLKGKIFKMSPAPARVHQAILRNINRKFDTYFQNRPCELYFAPFDVRLPNKNGEIFTVVQPDLCVICDLNKLDDKGCIGAPDLIVEILSPGNTKKEMKNKYCIYEESGVLEYWLVHPLDKSIQVFVLKDDIYIGLQPVIEGEIITSKTFPELSFSTEQIFADL